MLSQVSKKLRGCKRGVSAHYAASCLNLPATNKMTKVSELSLDIELMLVQDFHPATISALLDVPVSWVYEVIEEVDSVTGSFDPFDTINS